MPTKRPRPESNPLFQELQDAINAKRAVARDLARQRAAGASFTPQEEIDHYNEEVYRRRAKRQQGAEMLARQAEQREAFRRTQRELGLSEAEAGLDAPRAVQRVQSRFVSNNAHPPVTPRLMRYVSTQAPAQAPESVTPAVPDIPVSIPPARLPSPVLTPSQLAGKPVGMDTFRIPGAAQGTLILGAGLVGVVLWPSVLAPLIQGPIWNGKAATFTSADPWSLVIPASLFMGGLIFLSSLSPDIAQLTLWFVVALWIVYVVMNPGLVTKALGAVTVTGTPPPATPAVPAQAPPAKP